MPGIFVIGRLCFKNVVFKSIASKDTVGIEIEFFFNEFTLKVPLSDFRFFFISFLKFSVGV
jgi:hypothetical protein